MPGARLESFRKGDRTELLVELWLSVLAFTTRVPRQEDVGHDFVCVLAEPKDGMVWAGPSFTVQAKSDTKPLVFATEYGRQWIREQDNPMFLAVGNRDESRVDLYSTWRRVNEALEGLGGAVRICVGPASGEGCYVEVSEDGCTQTVHTGRPIVSATLDELSDSDRAARTRAVIRRWVEIDRENIVCTRAGMNWVVGPGEHETNEVPTGPFQLALHWNAANLRVCARNFGRAATALRLTLLNHSSPPEVSNAQVVALESALRAWDGALDMGARAALSIQAKLELGPDRFEISPLEEAKP